MAAVRPHELRQGTAGAERARIARRSACALPSGAGRREVVSALDAARLALEAAGGEAEAVAHSERSGLARFAGSEVHQPTLIENVVVTLRVVRGNRVGVATTNKVGDEGLAELVGRAATAAESARPDESFPGLAPPTRPPDAGGYDEATAALEPDEQAR